MSFLSFIAKIFPENTAVHKTYDKADILLDKVGNSVFSLFGGQESATALKQTGQDVLSAYSESLANAIQGTSANISAGAVGGMRRNEIIDYLVRNWFFILLAIVAIILLKKKKR
jgi:hypothetical protein